MFGKKEALIETLQHNLRHLENQYNNLYDAAYCYVAAANRPNPDDLKLYSYLLDLAHELGIDPRSIRTDVPNPLGE